MSSIKGVVSRVATVGGKLTGTTNLRAKQVSIGSQSGVDLTAKSIQELSAENEALKEKLEDVMARLDAANI